MITSEKIDELSVALAKAQGLIDHAEKDSQNPHFKSSFASLASVIKAIKKPFSDHGLSYVQPLSRNGIDVVCTTRLMHASGQWVEDSIAATPQQNTPQAVGSCATYLRRYSLMAMAGVAPDDDDGNEATFAPRQTSKAPPPVESKSDLPNEPYNHDNVRHKIFLKKLKENYAIPMDKWMECDAEMVGIPIPNLKAAVEEFKGMLAK